MNVGYIRVSTERQHLKNQKDEIQRYADHNNIGIDMWVSEIVSGKRKISGRKLWRYASPRAWFMEGEKDILQKWMY